MAFCIVNKGSNNSPKSYVSCNSTLHKDFIHGKLKENTSILSFILVGTMIKLKCIYHKLLLSLRYIHLNLKLGFCLTAVNLCSQNWDHGSCSHKSHINNFFRKRLII
jgi:hypothetical protein